MIELSDLLSLSPYAILRTEPQYYNVYAVFDWRRVRTVFLSEDEERILEQLYGKAISIMDVSKATGIDHNKCEAFLERMLKEKYVLRVDSPPKVPPRYKVELERFTGFQVPFLSAPNSIDIFITNRCNLKCLHCFSAKEEANADLPLCDLRRIFDELEMMGVFEVRLNGGEPLLHPEIEEILLDLKDRRLRRVLLTNATLLNERIVSLLKDSITIPTISLDDSLEEEHDRFRGKGGSFKATLHGIRLLKENGVEYGVNACPNKRSLKRATELIDLACKEGATRISFLSLKPEGTMKKNMELIPSHKDYERLMIRLLVERQRMRGRIDVAVDALLHCYTLEEAKQEAQRGYVCCQAGINCLSIDCRGIVYPCNTVIYDPHWAIGDTKNEKLRDIWFSRKWAFFRGSVRISDLNKCASCKKLSQCLDYNCRLGAYINTSDPLGAPYMCNK